MKKLLKWLVISLAILFISIQFIRPARTNPAIDETRTLEAAAHMPTEINAILSRSCNDCHSNRTVWPWYSQVAPISWWLIDHVNEGRRELNFSTWAQYDREEAIKRLKDICKEVESGAMPMRSYTRGHPGAKLSPDDVRKLCDWSKEESRRLSERAKRGDATAALN